MVTRRKRTPAVTVKLEKGKPVLVKGAGPTALIPAPKKDADKDIETAKKAATALLLTLQTSVTPEMVIETEEEYQQADLMLGQLRNGRKDWGDVMEDIIRPIASGLQKLYALNRGVDKPLAAVETLLKRKMADYMLKKEQARQAIEDAKERERQKLLAKAQTLVTPAARARVEEQLEALDAAQPEPEPVAAHSSSMPVRKWRVTDIRKFCKGIADGLIPEDVIEIKLGRMNGYHREDTETVEGWPGVEGYDDVQIAGR